jgi:hypothetical protein
MNPGLINITHDSIKLTPDECELVSLVCHLYTALEFIATHDCVNLTDRGKANIKRAQGELQQLRLKLLDHFQQMKINK